MSLFFDTGQSIASPALAPTQHVHEPQRADALTIGLINNMPDSALKATERQFMQLVQGAAGSTPVRFRCFSLPSVSRSPSIKSHIGRHYADVNDLDRVQLDGLIVTGAEPLASRLTEERFWRELTEIVDWAKTNTRSAIWSCLAAHAAALYLDGVERRPLREKCSGVYDCKTSTGHWLTSGLPTSYKVPHSRSNELSEADLVSRGYQILTRSDVAGVDIFARQFGSRFVFFQGHPEYDASSLQREYMRDLARYLSGEREIYPAIPNGYFDAATELRLASFAERARSRRDPMLAAELPGLTLRGDIDAGAGARILFSNWLAFLTLAESPATT